MRERSREYLEFHERVHRRKDLRQVERRLAAALRRRMEKMGASPRWLVIESGVANSTLRRLLGLHKDRDYRLRMMDYLALCEVLNLNPAVLLREAVYD